MWVTEVQAVDGEEADRHGGRLAKVWPTGWGLTVVFVLSVQGRGHHITGSRTPFPPTRRKAAMG